MPDNLSIATTYANQILTAKIPACVETRQACQRFIDDLENPLYYYDPSEVDRVIDFLGCLDLSEQNTPKKFVPVPWQIHILCNIYGIREKKSGLRKYSSALIEIPKKQGKSQLATGLATFHFLFENSAEIYVAANSLRQAKDVNFKKIKEYCDQLDPKQKHLIQYYNSVQFNNNVLRAVASDASKLNGINASFVIIDEMAEATSNKVYNALISSQGSRTEPLFIVITTAGFDTENFYYSLRTYCKEILSGEKQDSSQFCIIYTLDPEDDYTNPDVWPKAHPNLGISERPEYLKKRVETANNNVSERSGVLVYNFNIWQKSDLGQVWLNDELVDNTLKPLNLEDFKNKQCWASVDLSSVSDITALSLMFKENGIHYFFNYYFLPEQNVNTNMNKNLFKEANQNGNLFFVEGNAVDYDYVINFLLQLRKDHKIKLITYDTWNAIQFRILAELNKFKMFGMSQGMGTFNKPTKEFERLMRNGKIQIQENKITSWMLKHSILKEDVKNNNCKPVRPSRHKKIDGVISMIGCLHGFLENPVKEAKVY